MSLEVFRCEQGSPEWYQCRLGIVTASEFETVLRERGRTAGSTSKQRRDYMLKLIGERLTGEPMWTYTNEHMERGKAMEAEARDLYCFMREAEVERVGFLRNGEKGCSPDGLIGANGMSEIKTKLPHLHCDVLLSDAVPSEHVAQCQGALWIAEREWLDFVSYWPGLPLFVKRVYRDEKFITHLAHQVDVFINELKTVMEAVKGYKAKEAA